ncbi:hypothetical protein RI367_006430 [Sorochytrium milnesiophthora]
METGNVGARHVLHTPRLYYAAPVTGVARGDGDRGGYQPVGAAASGPAAGGSVLHRLRNLTRGVNNYLESARGHLVVIVLVITDLLCVFTEISLELYICSQIESGHRSPHDKGGQLHEIAEYFGYVSMAIVVFFAFEILVKVVVLGARFFRSAFNVFDAVIVIASLSLEVVLRGLAFDIAGLVVIFRLWRVVRIVHGVSEALELEHEGHLSRLDVKIEQLESRVEEESRQRKQLASLIQSRHPTALQDHEMRQLVLAVVDTDRDDAAGLA